MKVKHFKGFLMPFLCFFVADEAGAQNIRGDTIYVDASSEVAIVFPTSPNAQLVPLNGQEGLYETRDMGKKTVSVIAKKKGAMDQGLNIAEGRRNHFLILSYKEGSPARTIDYSTIRKLSARAEQVKKGVTNLLNEADSGYDRAKNNLSDLVLWKEVEAKYKRLENVVEPAFLDLVKYRLEESGKQFEGIKDKKYNDAIKEGQNYFFLKNYPEARKEYVKALEHKPGDVQALRYINLTDSVWAKVYIDKGDDANKAKNYMLAMTNFEEAFRIKPDYPSLQKKFNQAKEDAVPQIYEIERKKGDLAMKAYELKEARRAYDAALSVRPENKYIKSQLKILVAEEEKINQEEKKEAAYQGVLAIAKSLAESATNIQEYELAIKEYERAAKIIPSRIFPRKRIAQLTKIKKGFTAK